MMKRTRIGQHDLGDGWYWCRLWVNLRKGAFHHEWLPARVQGGRVQLFGSTAFKPLDAPVLENALWTLIKPPPLEATTTALALERPGNRQKRKNRRLNAGGDPRIAAKAQVVAEGIVDAFLSTVDSLGIYYAEHPDDRSALVEKIAGAIEQAFDGRSVTEEA